VQTFRQFAPSFLNANLRGGIVHQTGEMAAVLRENDVDIACTTETWLSRSVPSELVNIPVYVMHRSDQEDGRRGGGVAVFVRCSLPCVRLWALESANFESIWLLYRQLRMPRAVSHVIVGAVYHPPSADHRAMTSHILDCLDTTTRDHPHAGVVLFGDFNQLRDGALLAYPLRQVVKAPTRGAAVLDKIYTGLKDWYSPPVLLFCRTLDIQTTAQLSWYRNSGQQTVVRR